MTFIFRKWMSSPGLLSCFLLSLFLVVVYQFADRARLATSDVFLWTTNQPRLRMRERMMALLEDNIAGVQWNETSSVPMEGTASTLPLSREMRETKESVLKILESTSDFKSLLQKSLLRPSSVSVQQTNLSSTLVSQMDNMVRPIVERVSIALEKSQRTAIESVREKMEILEKLVSDGLVAHSGQEKSDTPPNLRKNGEQSGAIKDCPVSASTPQTLMWRPRPGKFLLTTCVYEQMSNRMGCIRATMIYAAILKRTMIFPSADSSDRKYNFSLILDVEHARKCLQGNDSNDKAPPIVTLDEYLATHGGRLEIENIRCWRKHCQMRNTNVFDMKQYPTVVFPPKHKYWALSGASNESTMLTRDFMKFYDVKDDVLVMGDLFNTRLSDSPHLISAPPFVRNCKTVFQPHPAIMEAATGFVRTFLGPNFMAAHWRRGDFFNYCKGCFHSVRESADCLRQHAFQYNTPILYLATNAEENEVDLLRDLLRMPSDKLPHALSVVHLPRGELSNNGPWAESLRQLDFEHDSRLIRLTLDRTICALSRVFLSTRGSTFSAEIRGFRKEIGQQTCNDKNICPRDAQDMPRI